MASVDVKQYWTMLTHWSQLVPNNYVSQHPRTLSNTTAAASLFPQCPCRGRLFVCCCGLCSSQGRACKYFSMGCSVVSHWCMFIMLPCSQRALILVPTYEKFRRDCRGVVVAMASVYIVCVQISSFMLRSDQHFHHVYSWYWLADM